LNFELRTPRLADLVVVLICFVTGTGCATVPGSLYVVTAPVTDLRAQPGSVAVPNTHDPFEETQLLYGERVKVLKTEQAWAFVEAIEQPEFNHTNAWQGYPGWVPQDVLQPIHGLAQPNAVITTKWAAVWQDSQGTTPWLQLPMGTKIAVSSTQGVLWRLQLIDGTVAWISPADAQLVRRLKRLSESGRRQAILRAAEQSLGDPYFWGGRSPFVGSTEFGVTGVDCSGLVNLAYRTVGIDVPRDAHEQYLRANTIAKPQPADLVFLSEPDNPKKIVHVMLYVGDGRIIEGPGTGLVVRRIEITERLGRPIEQLKPGDQLNDQTLFFGSYLP